MFQGNIPLNFPQLCLSDYIIAKKILILAHIREKCTVITVVGLVVTKLFCMLYCTGHGQ